MAAAIAGAVAALLYRGRRERGGAPFADSGSTDARAEELRRKLDEYRSLASEREEFEAAETTVDQVQSADEELARRRSEVHDEGRVAAERMRRSSEVEGA